jgi:hypothetical protein
MASALHAALAVAMPIVDAQLGQSSTDLLQSCHLAVEHPCAHMINSLGRRHLRPTLCRALAMSLHRVFDAQSAQTAPCVPVHARMRTSRTMHDCAWRPAHDAKPPSPCPLTDRTDPGRPGFRQARTKPEMPSTGPLHHRHHHPYA